MKKILLICLLSVLCLHTKAQVVTYQFAETISESQSEITFRVYVFSKSKKTIEQEAQLAGLRCLMFNGIPDTKFNKPLLDEGEVKTKDNNPEYFDDLYSRRYTDYVSGCVMKSKFKKSGVGKSTLFEVTVRPFEIRKDLEKNKIKTKLGI